MVRRHARTWPRLGAGGDGGGDEDSVLHARGEGALGIRRSSVVDGATRMHSTATIIARPRIRQDSHSGVKHRPQNMAFLSGYRS